MAPFSSEKGPYTSFNEHSCHNVHLCDLHADVRDGLSSPEDLQRGVLHCSTKGERPARVYFEGARRGYCPP